MTVAHRTAIFMIPKSAGHDGKMKKKTRKFKNSKIWRELTEAQDNTRQEILFGQCKSSVSR
jgi:hypothetical protein